VATYLLKTEPSEYSFADLVRDKQTVWDGVTNAAALKHLREIRKGDFLVIYHTGDERQAVGLAQAASDPYADPGATDPRHVVVDVKPGKSLPTPVPLAEFRSDPVLATTELVRITRLSVLPLTDEHFARLLELAGA
jgi:predicted RNA-binding protein with PUA-like domain